MPAIVWIEPSREYRTVPLLTKAAGNAVVDDFVSNRPPASSVTEAFAPQMSDVV